MHLRFTTKILALILIFAPLWLLADTESEGWSWTISCPGDGTSFTGSGTFNSSTATGFIGSGGCTRVSTHFTQFTFTSSTGGTLTSNILYGLHTGDWLIIPPTLSTETYPVYAVSSACPAANTNLNWVFIQWNASAQGLQNTYLLGTAAYNTASGVTITGQYDVTGAAYWLGVTSMPGTCSNGVYPVSGQSSADLNGTAYFTTDGSGVYKSNPGHATFFFPQYTMNLSNDLGAKTYYGMTFDSHVGSDTRNTLVTSNAAGTQFSVTLYLNPGTGTMDTSGASYTDTIYVTTANTPQPGMLLGSVVRTGSGAGSGKLACIVNKSVDTRVICSGQSPSGNSYPYTLTFMMEGMYVLGQPNSMTVQSTELGFDAPTFAMSDGTKLFAADASNHRVLIWNTIPTSSQTAPDVVLGQPTLAWREGNYPNGTTTNPTATSLLWPYAVHSTGSMLFVADMGNSRILIWNTIPTINMQAANVVVGQPDMTTSTANYPSGTPSASSLYDPEGVYSDGTKLYVSDYYNSRVLIWNSIPVANQVAANVELGQANMTTGTSGLTVAPNTLYYPQGIYVAGTKLFVADAENARVLIWNTIPVANAASANVAVGEATTSTDSWGTTAADNQLTTGVCVKGTQLIVTDEGNSRVLVWNTIPVTSGTSATFVLGQLNMSSSGAGITSTNLYNPYSATSDGTRLIVTDYANNRIRFGTPCRPRRIRRRVSSSANPI